MKAAGHFLLYLLLASGLGAETEANSVDHRAILEKLDDSGCGRWHRIRGVGIPYHKQGS